VAPRMCKPWNNLFAAASFIDSICIRNAVLLPSQSLVNQHPCNIETESETETHTPLHRQKESTREASFWFCTTAVLWSLRTWSGRSKAL
jgi:hypothetical protein